MWLDSWTDISWAGSLQHLPHLEVVSAMRFLLKNGKYQTECSRIMVPKIFKQID